MLEEAAEHILNTLSSKFEKVFADVAMKKDLAIDWKPKKMVIVSTEAMLSEARIGIHSARILFQHIRQFLGHPLVESGKKKKALLWLKLLPPQMITLLLVNN